MEIWNYFVQFMAQLLTYCFDFTQTLGFPSYGIAIIILTIIIKAVLSPLTVKQIKSMRGMQKLQPRMKELQEKYKKDPKKLQMEMGKLYKEMGVNPLSGCLPLIVQMPFLIAMFYALRDYAYNPAYEHFLWLPSLSATDPWYILPILSAISTYFMSKQTAVDGGMGGQQKIMQIFMPLFIGYISLQFPSGLVIYWVVSNLFQLVQQSFIYRHMDKEEA